MYESPGKKILLLPSSLQITAVSEVTWARTIQENRSQIPDPLKPWDNPYLLLFQVIGYAAVDNGNTQERSLGRVEMAIREGFLEEVINELVLKDE